MIPLTTVIKNFPNYPYEKGPSMSVEKVNIYKIKEGITDFFEFIKDKDSKKKVLPTLKDLMLPKIEGFEGCVVAKAAFKTVGGNKKTENDIPWLVFINQGKSGDDKFTFSSLNIFPSAIIAVKITRQGKDSFYALTFGIAGDSFLNNDMIVHDFGIKVAMNICDENKLNRIQTSAHEAVSTQTERQISTSSSWSTFNINGEKEFLRVLSGSARSQFNYISSFKGKESISIKFEKGDILTWESLIPRLDKLGEASWDDRYKNLFPEYDKFPFETNRETIQKLDGLLFFKFLSNDLEKVHLSPPEFLDYDNLSFQYDTEINSKKYNELILSDLLSQRKVKFKEDGRIDILKGLKISLYDSTTCFVQKSKWSAYICLVAEIEKNGQTFILSRGHWKRVSRDLLQEVSDCIASIKLSNPPYLPEAISIWNPQARGGNNGKPYIGENQEAIYNEVAAKASTDLFLFDKGKIEIGGAKKYEVCDILHKDKKFIQVKRFSSGSASISHIFVQARFYADAFLRDEKCRPSMRMYVEDNAGEQDIECFKEILPDNRQDFTASDYTVVLCLLTDRDGLQIADLPFMARYELMHTLRHLTNSDLKYEVVIRKVIFNHEV